MNLIPKPLKPEEIRWFYQKPSTYWIPFDGHDSLSLEECYQHSGDKDEGEGKKICEVTVLDDFYRADIEMRTLEPFYWKSDPEKKWKILRGIWYEVIENRMHGDKWYPFTEEDNTLIEQEHVSNAWRETLTVSETEEDVTVHILNFEDYDIVWLANRKVYKLNNDFFSKLKNKFGNVFGHFLGGTEIVRGYKDLAMASDEGSPVGHVVFVTHGIAQVLESNRIEETTAEFREVSERVADKFFGEKERKRVEYIPVEWRTELSLDKGFISTITPDGFDTIRGIVNDVILDIFYYLSQRYGPEIINGLRRALQTQYNKFMRSHPHFLDNGGTVSILAHSLGCVVVYDVLYQKWKLDPDLNCNLPQCKHSPIPLESESIGNDTLRREIKEMTEKLALLENELVLKTTPLDFKIDHFFAVGSPISLFLSMRDHESIVNKDHRGTASFLPTEICKKIHNIRHPADLVAYRLEPMINPMYAQIKSVTLDHTDDSDNEDDDEDAKSLNKLADEIESKIQAGQKILDSDEPDEKFQERLDFVLNESANYFALLSAHTSYWKSVDCAHYILEELYN